jgi:DNA-binding CsgD family transcriptional regulator
MNGDVNEFVLGLHRAAKRMPHVDLRDWIFGELQQLMHFDSALWFRWSGCREGSPMQAWYAYRQPESFLAEYVALELWRDDVARAAKEPDHCPRTVRASCVDYNSQRMRHFLKRYHQEHVLVSSAPTEVPQMVDGVSLHRDETHPPFSDHEAATMEQLTPHVVDVWRENRLRELARSASSEPPFEGFSIAVLMPDLAMSEAQSDFSDLLRLEWPRWQGPMLPTELETHLQAATHKPWSGKSITVYIRRQVDGTLLVFARRAHPIDALAPRKREVALLFSRGASQTQIARQLQLSPSTVNNYIGIVYEVLELRGKTDLSRLLVRLEP